MEVIKDFSVRVWKIFLGSSLITTEIRGKINVIIKSNPMMSRNFVSFEFCCVLALKTTFNSKNKIIRLSHEYGWKNVNDSIRAQK